MAKEVDLKKIELKVSVNCCYGCKKKVKKVIQSIEGVLKTEIDPSQPKVSVLGNVDPQILIKKLLKAGKQAEICSHGNQNAGKEKRDADTALTGEREDSRSGCEQAKCSDLSSTATDKRKESENEGKAGRKEASKKDQETNGGAHSSSRPGVTKNENPLPPHPDINCSTTPNTLHDIGHVSSYREYCYIIEPHAINLPYYVIPSYAAHPLPPTCYGQEHRYHKRLVSEPPVQIPVAQAGDYFSDENTVGCHVM